MWKIPTLALMLLVNGAAPTALAASTDTLTMSEIKADDGLYIMAETIGFVTSLEDADYDAVLAAFEDATVDIEYFGLDITESDLHSIHRTLALQIWSDLGNELTAKLFSLDGMATTRMALTHSDTNAWLTKVDALGLGSFLDYGDDAPEPQESKSGAKTGGAIGSVIGVVVGFLSGGPAGAVAGAVAGEMSGRAVGDAIGDAAEGCKERGLKWPCKKP
jgi:hypothetical protein